MKDNQIHIFVFVLLKYVSQSDQVSKYVTGLGI